jgi:hypothetical protein
LNLVSGATKKNVKTVIATFAVSPQLSSLFLFSSKTILLGDEKHDTRSTELSILWAVLARRNLERKAKNDNRRQSMSREQTSKSLGEARGNQMPSLQQHQNLERWKVFHSKRRRLAALPLQRLRLSIHALIENNPSLFSFSCQESSF